MEARTWHNRAHAIYVVLNFLVSDPMTPRYYENAQGAYNNTHIQWGLRRGGLTPALAPRMPVIPRMYAMWYR